MMMIRFVVLGAIALAASGTQAAAQGRPPQQAVVPDSVMKSMTAKKPRTKTALGARVGMVRNAGPAAKPVAGAAPTSVKEIKPATKK
jgi:hypothetical protein